MPIQKKVVYLYIEKEKINNQLKIKDMKDLFTRFERFNERHPKMVLVYLFFVAVFLVLFGKYGIDLLFPIQYTHVPDVVEPIKEVNPYSFVQLGSF